MHIFYLTFLKERNCAVLMDLLGLEGDKYTRNNNNNNNNNNNQ